MRRPLSKPAYQPSWVTESATCPESGDHYPQENSDLPSQVARAPRFQQLGHLPVPKRQEGETSLRPDEQFLDFRL